MANEHIFKNAQHRQLESKNYNAVSPHTSQNGHHQKNVQIINAGESVEEKEPSYTVDGTVSWYSRLKNLKSQTNVLYSSVVSFWYLNSVMFFILCCYESVLLSHVQLFVTLWTIAHQAPLFMEFSRQEYWSGLHALLWGIFSTQGSNPGILHCGQILYHLSHQGSLITIKHASGMSFG